jgi:hypothetical protein
MMKRTWKLILNWLVWEKNKNGAWNKISIRIWGDHKKLFRTKTHHKLRIEQTKKCQQLLQLL